MHTMVCTDNFLGAYDPEPTDILDFINLNLKAGTNLVGVAANDSASNVNDYTGRRRLLSTTTFNNTVFTGIKNPIVCLEYGELMLFGVDNNNYPIYDM